MQTALRPPVRLIMGLSAAVAAIGFVILAGLTAPRADSALHISAKCPDSAGDSPLPSGTSGAEKPA